MDTRIGTETDQAASLLKEGALVALPTETVYGLAASIRFPDALARIFAVKNRPTFNPLIVHVSSREEMRSLVTEMPPQILLDRFTPGPLTFLLPRSNLVPDIVTAGLPHVAVRIPCHPLTLEVLKSTGPLAAPSANPFGYISPTLASHVLDQLNGQIPYILDGGRAFIGVESTVIGFDQANVILYREGGVSKEALEAVIGPVTKSSSPSSPGQLKSHYAPKKPMILGDIETLLYSSGLENGNFAALSFQKRVEAPYSYQLAPDGKLETAAYNLFYALRFLDSLPVDYIIAEKVPEIGLGRAINDRLMRAASQG